MGYCASKKQWYYGFKLHLQVTNQGLAMGYVVTEASCHDVKAAETVMTPIPHPTTLGTKVHQPRSSRKAVRRTPSRVLDTVSTQSKARPIQGMGRMDPKKTQSDRDGVLGSG
ncbi:hypothetical protein LR68_04314 [Anoxybacillus sp. BCO1]|nr:hypothetical protein LR68_04314 [Anoxybacillus sp. BCO1]